MKQKKEDPTRYIKELQRLTREDSQEDIDFSREGRPFWPKSDPNIFKAHPDAAKGILFNPNPKVYSKNKRY